MKLDKTQTKMLLLFGSAILLYLILAPPADNENLFTV